MSKLNLLPSGRFEVTMEDGSIIVGRYDDKALKMFSDINGGLGFSDTWTLIIGGNASVTTYLQLIMCAIKSQGKTIDEFGVLGIIIELGGLWSDESQALLGHFSDLFVPKKKVEQNGVSHGVSS